MLRMLALALAVLVAGCGTSTTQAAKRTTSSSQPASPSVVPITPSPTPSSAAADLPLSPVSFSCRLPVTTLTNGAESMTYQGGFISFPSATYTADPDGVISLVGGYFVTKKTPVLTGAFTPPFLDAAAGRWLPSPAGRTSPDGSSYAYATAGGAGTSTIHVVNVTQGTEKTYRVASPSPAGAEVEDDDGSAVYFAEGIVEGYPHGVWRLDLLTGNVTQMAQASNVLAVRDGYAWAGAVDPHDPSPPRVGGPVLFDTITQVNLASQVTTTWYYTQARAEFLLGLASGDRPIVAVSDGPDFGLTNAEVRLIDHPNTSAEDNGELVSAPGLSLETPQADGDRTWFSGPGGIYLYTSAGGLQRVFAGGDNPKAGGQILPAGFCR